ncbi:hypothetical protein, partial [Arthrobacter sp. DR-2P]
EPHHSSIFAGRDVRRPSGLRRLHDVGHRLVADIPQRAVPEPSL